LNHF